MEIYYSKQNIFKTNLIKNVYEYYQHNFIDAKTKKSNWNT